MSRRPFIAIVVGCVPLSACAALTPATPPSPQHERASPAPREMLSAPGAATPEQAIRRFASAYINWTADSVGRDMRALAAASIGQARSALQLAAAQTTGDYELRRGGIANSGTVEAVAPLPNSENRYVVVTRESTTATDSAAYEGLRPAWHVAIATVDRLPGGAWVLSGWQPQS